MEILGRNYDKSSLSLGSKSDPEASSPLSCPQSSRPADGQQAASPGAVPSSYPAGALAPGQPPPGRHEAVPARHPRVKPALLTHQGQVGAEAALFTLRTA